MHNSVTVTEYAARIGKFCIFYSHLFLFLNSQ